MDLIDSPRCVVHIFGFKHLFPSSEKPSPEQAVLSHKTLFFGPCGCVFWKHIIQHLPPINDIVVSHCNQLSVGQHNVPRNRNQDTDRKLVANDEDHVRLATDAHPVFLFHLFENHILQGLSGVRKFLWAHAPEKRIPIQDYPIWLIVSMIIEEHGK
jgi:hypothetical protein